jgi:hypothetical protein
MRAQALLPAFALFSATLAAGCSGAGATADTDFSSLDSSDAKADGLGRFRVVGTLGYGDTTTVDYSNPPRYRALKFQGADGDDVTVTVHSDDGVAKLWVLDGSKQILGADTGADATVHLTLSAQAVPTHYIVLRELDLQSASFTVSLQGGPTKPDFYSCKADDDCVAVPKKMCCSNCSKEAVNKDMADAYSNQQLVCPAVICPLACFLDTRVAECNHSTHKCEMVAIDAISCGGFVVNPHQCPAGYACEQTVHIPDAPGKCVKQCVQNEACVQGDHWDSQACKCVPDVSDCRTTGCPNDQWCSACFGAFACIPKGALC